MDDSAAPCGLCSHDIHRFVEYRLWIYIMRFVKCLSFTLRLARLFMASSLQSLDLGNGRRHWRKEKASQGRKHQDDRTFEHLSKRKNSGATWPQRGKSHCRVITSTLWWNISLLMGLISNEGSISRRFHPSSRVRTLRYPVYPVYSIDTLFIMNQTVIWGCNLRRSSSCQRQTQLFLISDRGNDLSAVRAVVSAHIK